MVVIKKPATDVPPAATPTPWVLIVEPDPSRRRAACQAWEDAGFGVELASSATEAEACLKVMTPAFVVVDGRAYRRDRR